MTKRFKHKDQISKIMLGLIVVFVLIIIALMLIPIPMGDDYAKRSQEKVALNFAATVAQTVGTYYSETDSTDFIGIETGYDGNYLIINDSINIGQPKAYKCEILDSLVVVTHIDGAKGEIRWR